MQNNELTLTAEQRETMSVGIAHTLRVLRQLRGAIALRHLGEVNACREELRKTLSIINAQGSQALPDPDEMF